MILHHWEAVLAGTENTFDRPVWMSRQCSLSSACMINHWLLHVHTDRHTHTHTHICGLEKRRGGKQETENSGVEGENESMQGTERDRQRHRDRERWCGEDKELTHKINMKPNTHTHTHTHKRHTFSSKEQPPRAMRAIQVPLISAGGGLICPPHALWGSAYATCPW